MLEIRRTKQGNFWRQTFKFSINGYLYLKFNVLFTTHQHNHLTNQNAKTKNETCLLRNFVVSAEANMMASGKNLICMNALGQRNFVKLLSSADDDYTMVSDLENETQVFGVDLHYHKLCLDSYLNQYDRSAAISKQNKGFQKNDCSSWLR